MDELEYTQGLQYAFIAGKENEAMDEFLAYVRENCSALDTNVHKIVQMAEDTARLLLNWGVYSHRGTQQRGKYESKYTVHVDYRNLLIGLDAKVIVLDGTADISPMYKEDYIHMITHRSFARSLSCLTIKLCDVPTGETDLRGDMIGTAKMIYRYLADAAEHDRNLVIFSSQNMEAAFRAIGFDQVHTGHFNNIKGLNSYKRACNIAQVGLNRMPPVNYLTLDLARNEEIRAQLTSNAFSEDPAAAMRMARRAMEYDAKAMTQYVLADLEQNMYRGAIRDAANIRRFTYYVFFSHADYPKLIESIKTRYEALDAKVEFVPRTAVEAFRVKSEVEQRIEAVEVWFEGWDGKPIRQSEVYKTLEIGLVDFKNMLKHQRAEKVVRLLKEAKEEAARQGLKKGWLAK